MDETADPRPAAAPASGPRPRLAVVLVVIAVVVVTLDQLAKQWALAELAGDAGPTTVVDGWLRLRLVYNSGAAFSLGTGSTWIFTVIATVVSLFILRTARRVGSRGWAVALGLLLGGAVGNLVDRLVRAPGVGRGHVIDYVESLRLPWPNFPVFNVADACIVTAAVLIFVLGVRGVALDGSREPAPTRATPGG